MKIWNAVKMKVEIMVKVEGQVTVVACAKEYFFVGIA